MIAYIYIPTLGRWEKQITYNNLPEEWKEKTTLVVQHHEKEQYIDLYGDDSVFVLPSHIETIAPTREWIVKYLGGKSYFCMFDDDINFYRTRMEGEEGPSKSLMTDKDFEIQILKQGEDFLRTSHPELLNINEPLAIIVNGNGK